MYYTVTCTIYLKADTAKDARCKFVEMVAGGSEDIEVVPDSLVAPKTPD